MDEMIKTTCLHQAHLDLAAKMSPFAGFDMPIQYSSISDEHNAVRQNVGIFDVSHMGEIFVSGPQGLEFVNYIFTNDISKLHAGEIVYGMMCYENGTTVDDLLVYKNEGDGNYLLVVNASNIDKDYAWICEQAKKFDVVVDNQSERWGQIAVQGPESEKFVKEVLGFEKASEIAYYNFANVEYKGEKVILSRTGYTGEDGFEIYASPSLICEFWQKLVEAGVLPCGLGCRDTLRFEAGMPLYGHELSDKISPVMSGLSMFCKFDKENFIGKEALLKQKTEGVEYKVVGLEVLDRAIAREGCTVETADGQEIGVITTGYRSVTLDRSLCFALVKAEHAAMGSELMVRVRKKVFPAKVIKKRFYTKA